MSDDTFQSFIERERERITGERQALTDQRSALSEQIATLDRELSAISAYETAKTKFGGVVATKTIRTQGTVKRGGQSKREEVLTVIKNQPTGVGRGEILQLMGLKGNKSAEMMVSNALTALVKGNQVARQDGKYVAAAP